MKQNISNHRSRAGRMKNFFTAKNALIAPHTDILDEINLFYTMLTQFDDFAMKQQRPIKAYAEAKRQAHEAAALITGKWGVRCHVKAEQSGMPALAELLNHNQSEIMRQEDEDSLNLMKDMRDGLGDNLSLFIPQGVTATIITEIDDNISAYETLINKPKEAISERKMDTEALAVLMKQINEKLELIVTLLEALWIPEHNELIIEMRNNMRIDNLGHRYSGLEGSVVNGLPDVANYSVVCEKEKTKPTDPNYVKETQSNFLGAYKIKSMKPGLYSVKLVNPQGVVVKSSMLTIKRGVTLDYNWTV